MPERKEKNGRDSDIGLSNYVYLYCRNSNLKTTLRITDGIITAYIKLLMPSLGAFNLYYLHECLLRIHNIFARLRLAHFLLRSYTNGRLKFLKQP
jgi:hypothetical protein